MGSIDRSIALHLTSKIAAKAVFLYREAGKGKLPHPIWLI
jgi:hypothetical protein